MNTPPQSDPLAPIFCFKCREGRVLPVSSECLTCHPKLGNIRIPDVPMLRCDHCGDTVVGPAGNALIDTWIDTALEQRRDKTRVLKQDMMREPPTGRTRHI